MSKPRPIIRRPLREAPVKPAEPVSPEKDSLPRGDSPVQPQQTRGSVLPRLQIRHKLRWS